MAVVGLGELVLDEHPVAGTGVAAEQICAKRTDCLFLGFEFELDLECLAEEGEVFLAREPGREVLGFIGPCVAQFYAFERTECVGCHREAVSCRSSMVYILLRDALAAWRAGAARSRWYEKPMQSE